uniref:Anaphase-promoting complex subunit 13 n=1 Tax=Cyprinus carpio TaxID=7962 RepID=A0A8C2D5B6_CYPCA
MFKEKEISSSESDITTNGSARQKAAGQTLIMDSEVQRDGRVLDLTDDAWREDRLPYEDVTIPLSELPESEQDNGGSTESVKEQEMKWSDLALQSLHENTPNVGT